MRSIDWLDLQAGVYHDPRHDDLWLVRKEQGQWQTVLIARDGQPHDDLEWIDLDYVLAVLILRQCQRVWTATTPQRLELEDMA